MRSTVTVPIRLRRPARLSAVSLRPATVAVDPADLAAVADLGPRAPVYHAAPDGRLRAAIEP